MLVLNLPDLLFRVCEGLRFCHFLSSQKGSKKERKPPLDPSTMLRDHFAQGPEVYTVIRKPPRLRSGTGSLRTPSVAEGER